MNTEKWADLMKKYINAIDDKNMFSNLLADLSNDIFDYKKDYKECEQNPFFPKAKLRLKRQQINRSMRDYQDTENRIKELNNVIKETGKQISELMKDTPKKVKFFIPGTDAFNEMMAKYVYEGDIII